MKNILILFLFLALSVASYSQNVFFDKVKIENFDSLSQNTREIILEYDSIFKSCLNDSCKYNTWQYAQHLIPGNEIKCEINQEALDYISKQQKEKSDSIEIMKNLKNLEMTFLGQMARAKRDNGEYEPALDYLAKVMDIAQETKDTNGIVYVYNEMAFICQMQEDFVGADKFYRKGANLDIGSSRIGSLISSYTNISYIFTQRIMTDSAIFYLKKCLPLFTDSTPNSVLANVYSNIGMNYSFLEPPALDSANKYLTKSEKLSEISNSLEDLYFTKSTRASIFEIKEDYEQSEKISLEVLELAEKLENNLYILNSLEYLAQIKLKKEDYKGLSETQARIGELKTKLWKEKDVHAMSDLEANLKYESEIELNKTKAESFKKESSLKSNIIYISIASLLLIGLFAVFLIINRKKLNQNKLRLEQLDRVNKQIFSVIAHDFKEPIINFNLLLKDIENKKSLDGEFVQELESQVKSSNNVLNNLLNWARIELEKQEVNKKSINLSELWNEVISTMETSIKKKALKVHNLFTPEDSMLGDAVMMEIVFRNLLSNAIKFSPENGTITVKNQNGSIQIIDEGIGMPDVNTDKIFKEKVNTRYGTNGETGFGIGLFIVNNLLGKNQKSISFSNNTPKGTIFTIQDS